MKPLAAAALVGLLVSCTFAPSAPQGAVIVCTGDAECPAPQFCHPFRHECVPPSSSLTLPLITAVTLTPRALTDGVATLLVEADRPLTSATLTFAAEAPALDVDVSVDGSSARFTIVVPVGAAEGVYRMARVEVTDEPGNSGLRELAGTALIVDRTPPQLTNLSLEDGTPNDGALVFADLAPHDVLTARLLVDEPVPVSATLAGAAVDCTGPVNGVATCTALIEPGSVSGERQLVLRAADEAGNAAERTVAVTVDVAAPVITSAAVGLRTSTGIVLDAASAGSVVELLVFFDEPLAADPRIVLDDGASERAMTVSQLTALSYSASALLQGALAGPLVPRADFTDRVGHVVVGAVVSDAIPVSEFAVSSCTVPPSLPCPDFDGDGVPAAGVGCGQVVDCDDTDPTVFPSAPEVPGDGKANGCGGGTDLAIDELTGVFVAEDGDDLSGDGTRAAPFASVDVAEAALAGREWIFAKAGVVSLAGTELATSLRGGLDDAFAPGGGRTTIVPDSDLSFEATGGVLMNVDVTFPLRVNATGALVIDVDAPNWFAGSNAMWIRSRCQAGAILAGAGARLIDARIDGALNVDLAATLIRTVVAGTTSASGAAARLTAVSSVFLDTVTCAPCGGVELHHSTVRSADLIALDMDGPLTLRGSSIESSGACTAISLTDGSRMTTVGSNFTGPGTLITVETIQNCTDAVHLADVDEIDACDYVQCLEARNSVSLLSAQVGFDLVHETVGSGLIDAASTADLALSPGAVIADVDGQCRFEGTPDLGADEL